MWIQEFSGSSTASADALFAVLADTATWPAWNAGVAAITLHGPFQEGTSAEMEFPDGSAVPFTLTWVEQGAGFEDLTVIPDEGISVRVRHTLAALDGGGTVITYRCEVDGPDGVAPAIGADITADFSDVIAALAARAEQQLV